MKDKDSIVEAAEAASRTHPPLMQVATQDLTTLEHSPTLNLDLTRLLSMQALRNVTMLKRDAKRLQKKSLQVFGTEYALTVCQKAMAVSRGFTSFANLEAISAKLGYGNPPQALQTTVPITEIDVYRATLEACVQAEASDQYKLALLLRAWVDGSPFHGCPTCNGRAPCQSEPPCNTCNGNGFLPDDVGQREP